MCAEASTVLRAVAADFYFNVRIWRFLRITAFDTYQGASTIMRKAFDWRSSGGYQYIEGIQCIVSFRRASSIIDLHLMITVKMVCGGQ
jgi:hypothetical protein